MVDPSSTLPLVSVVIPVFNGEQYLREGLDSILAQSYPRLEVLVMDDGSTDGTPDIIKSYGTPVKYYRQPVNRGIYGNANDGIAMAEGEYIAVYHADDVYHLSIVEREVSFLQQHPEAGAVFCLDIFVDAQGQEYGRLKLPPEVRGGQPMDYPMIFNAILEHKNTFFVCPTSMVRASVHRDVGVYRDNQFRNSSDLDMWLRIAQKYPVGILADYLLRYRHFDGQSSKRYHRLRTDPERYFVIMDHYLDNGDRALATTRSLAAYEAHRAEDGLMRVISHYILGQVEQSRIVLTQVQLRRILGSPRVQRGRLTVLYLALQLLVRITRIPFVANLFYQRWHMKSSHSKREFIQRILGRKPKNTPSFL